MISQTGFNADIAAGGERAHLALYELAGLVAGRATSDPDVAEDLAQATWVHLRQRVLAKVEAEGNPWSYLYIAAERFARQLARREQGHRAAGEDPDNPLERPDESPTPDEIVAARELVAPVLIRPAFRGLVRETQSGATYSHGGRFVANRAGHRLHRTKKSMTQLLQRARMAVTTRVPPGIRLPARAVVAISPEGHATTFRSYKSTWRTLGLDRRNLTACLSGKRASHKGYQFFWADLNVTPAATSSHVRTPTEATATHRGCTPTAA